MLERFRAKVSQSGNMRDRLELVEQDIGSFLTHGKDLYDVVGCSSFLHHVPDYLAVVDALGSRVKPGGFLYIAWEPLPTGSRTRPHQFLVRFDLGLDLLLHDPIGFVLAVSRHISRVIRHNVDTPKDQAALVDFHVPTGLDVSALEQTIKGRGFRVWMYSEFAGRRQPVAQILADRVLHVTDHFSLIAERTDERQGEELSGK
jgi:SAM-dependent methyltransferase